METAESNSTSDTDADLERNLASDDSNDGSVVIVAAIGEVALDIKEVSDGLAYGEVSSTAIDDLKVKDKDKTKSEGDSADQTEPVKIVATVDSTAPDLSYPARQWQWRHQHRAGTWSDRHSPDSRRRRQLIFLWTNQGQNQKDQVDRLRTLGQQTC